MAPARRSLGTNMALSTRWGSPRRGRTSTPDTLPIPNRERSGHGRGPIVLPGSAGRFSGKLPRCCSGRYLRPMLIHDLLRQADTVAGKPVTVSGRVIVTGADQAFLTPGPEAFERQERLPIRDGARIARHLMTAL